MAADHSRLEGYRRLVERGGTGGGDYAWWGLQKLGNLRIATTEWEEAYAVARETMGRVRDNVEIIIEFLMANGYRFGVIADDGLALRDPWLPPPDHTPALLTELDELVGPIPLSLRAWWEIVGDVRLVGAFPDEEETEAGVTFAMNDPLWIEGLPQLLQWRGWLEDEQDGRLPVVISPDILHKNNTSGGPAYKVLLPDARADTDLLDVQLYLPVPGRYWDGIRTAETFVQYLRRSLAWGGFPGLAFNELHWPDAVRAQRRRLEPLFSRLKSV
jgi:hypothetical protein